MNESEIALALLRRSEVIELKRELEAAKATILQDAELAGVFQKRAEAAEARAAKLGRNYKMIFSMHGEAQARATELEQERNGARAHAASLAKALEHYRNAEKTWQAESRWGADDDGEIARAALSTADAIDSAASEAEWAFNETMIRLRETEHLLSLAQDQLDAALLRIAKLERRDGEWVHDCGRLQEKLDTAQAHAARLADVCKQLIGYRDRAGALNFQLEKADDYHRMIRAALSAVPAELLNELELDAINKGARELAHLLLHDQGEGKLSPGPCADTLALWRTMVAEHTACIECQQMGGLESARKLGEAIAAVEAAKKGG